MHLLAKRNLLQYGQQTALLCLTSSWLFQIPETVVPRSVVMYNANLQETVAGTCMKYSVPDNNQSSHVYVLFFVHEYT